MYLSFPRVENPNNMFLYLLFGGFLKNYPKLIEILP